MIAFPPRPRHGSADFQALSRQVRVRMAELNLNQKELVRRAQTSAQVVRSLVRGTPHNYHPATLRKISIALGWEPDRLLLALSASVTDTDADRDLERVAPEPARRHAIEPANQPVHPLVRRLRALEGRVTRLRRELEARGLLS